MSKEKKEIDETELNLSAEDIKFFTERSAQTVSDGIGMRKYEQLSEKRQRFNNFSIQFPNKKNPYELSDLEKAQILEFESKRFIKTEPNEKEIEYWQKLTSGVKQNDFVNNGPSPTKKLLYTAFKILFKNIYKIEFFETPETLLNLGTVIKYFAADEEFLNSPLLVKEIDSKPIVPSFNKGLLLIGGYGCGKTTVLELISMVIDYYFQESYKGLWQTHIQWRKIRFKYAYCHRLVTEFEGLNSPEDRVLFMDKYTKPYYGFDDLTKEKPASNYGVKNLFQEIIEKRYDNRVITHATMNYPDAHPFDVSEALNLIGDKYGGHNYDRVKQMFNVIEFKGKSFRT